MKGEIVVPGTCPLQCGRVAASPRVLQRHPSCALRAQLRGTKLIEVLGGTRSTTFCSPL
jgi:hypothetical protein